MIKHFDVTSTSLSVNAQRKDPVSFPDFQKLDFRVGRVVSAEYMEGSINLIRMTVDLGSDYGIRTIFAGVAKWYKPEELRGKKFIFLANPAPKKIMGEESQGMMMAADVDNRAVLIPFDDKIPEGVVVR